MIAYWTNFAKTGDPNIGHSAVPTHWEPYTSENGSYLEITKKMDGSSLKRGLRTNFLRYWTLTYVALPTVTDQEATPVPATGDSESAPVPAMGDSQDAPVPLTSDSEAAPCPPQVTPRELRCLQSLASSIPRALVSRGRKGGTPEAPLPSLALPE
ncbi:bile salt-activated lipase-like [Macaca nemestrina]|uniref:bile salt-activated lipase-like n=1 Tax=Macaca nemestrina TaxID=9545 RepID=UPI0039B9B172